MSDKEFDSVVTVDVIAEEFRIPFLPVLIEKNEKLSVNTDFMSGWVEGEDESFLFMPSVDFVPLDDGTGFKIVIIDVEMDEARNTWASSHVFLKGSCEGEYLVQLDDEGYILEQRVVLSPEEAGEELPYYPPHGTTGHDAFKVLSFDPTAE